MKFPNNQRAMIRATFEFNTRHPGYLETEIGKAGCTIVEVEVDWSRNILNYTIVGDCLKEVAEGVKPKKIDISELQELSFKKSEPVRITETLSVTLPGKQVTEQFPVPKRSFGGQPGVPYDPDDPCRRQ